jgi:hypothetical protein
LYIIDVG